MCCFLIFSVHDRLTIVITCSYILKVANLLNKVINLEVTIDEVKHFDNSKPLDIPDKVFEKSF